MRTYKWLRGLGLALLCVAGSARAAVVVPPLNWVQLSNYIYSITTTYGSAAGTNDFGSLSYETNFLYALTTNSTWTRVTGYVSSASSQVKLSAADGTMTNDQAGFFLCQVASTVCATNVGITNWVDCALFTNGVRAAPVQWSSKPDTTNWVAGAAAAVLYLPANTWIDARMQRVQATNSSVWIRNHSLTLVGLGLGNFALSGAQVTNVFQALSIISNAVTLTTSGITSSNVATNAAITIAQAKIEGGTNNGSFKTLAVTPGSVAGITAAIRGNIGASQLVLQLQESNNAALVSFDAAGNQTNAGRIVAPAVNVGSLSVRTNAELAGATITNNLAYVPGTVAGTGGANTNFTLVAGSGPREIWIDGGTTNVHLVAVMGGDAASSYDLVVLITNRTATARTLSLGATTNQWISLTAYDGVSAPYTLTNGLALYLALKRTRSTNVVYAAKYLALPSY